MPRILTLLSRAYCHLCDEMRDAALPIAERYGATIVEVDIDARSDLEEAWGESVPVLLLGAPADGVEICRHRLDCAALEMLLATPGASAIS